MATEPYLASLMRWNALVMGGRIRRTRRHIGSDAAAGWKVIKLLWGADWDALFACDASDASGELMEARTVPPREPAWRTGCMWLHVRVDRATLEFSLAWIKGRGMARFSASRVFSIQFSQRIDADLGNPPQH